MHRRTVLQLAGVSALAAGGGLWWYFRLPGEVHSGYGSEVDLLFHDLRFSGRLVEALPQNHRVLSLSLDELSGELGMRLGLADADISAERFKEALHQTLEREYNGHDVVALDGWRIAHTEVLLAVIASKLHPVERPIAANSMESHIGDVTNWGPRQTTKGILPNSFGPGFAALWFDIQDIPPWVEVAIDGTRLPTTYREQRVLVATFRGLSEFQQQLFDTPGEHRITLHDDVTGRWQEVDAFTVLEDSGLNGDDRLCQASDWGPKQTGIATIANRQANGDMGVWVDIDCAPPDTVAVVGPQRFSTYRHSSGVLTFGIPAELLQQPGPIPIHLESDQAGERQWLGELLVITD